jgi:hypothetical protein
VSDVLETSTLESLVAGVTARPQQKHSPSTPPKETISMTRHPRIINLEHGFCDPALTKESLISVYSMNDGSRIEFAVLDATSAYIERGPRLEMNQLVIARSSSTVDLVQVRNLTDLIGMPEVALALRHFEAGRLKDAARYATAAGPRWAALVDLFGGPA